MGERKESPLNIKTEPGTYKRLPSFRTPRDLKLSEFRQPTNSVLEGRTKKVYIPNLNVQRKKAAEEAASFNHDSGADSEKGAKPEGRGRARQRKVPQFIQGSGVFSEGLACNTKNSRWGGRNHSNESSSTSIPKPKLNLSNEIKIDKEEEELVLKDLLRDDFIDDPEMKYDGSQYPIQLPLCGFETSFFKGGEPLLYSKDSSVLNGVKVKSDCKTSSVEVQKPRDIGQMKPLTVQELLLKSSENTFIFFQLPTCMPGPKVKIKQECVEQDLPSTSKNQSFVEESEVNERFVLRTLPPGRIGTLQILKSGRARFLLGDAKLWVEPGTQASFKQDLMSIPLDRSNLTGNMVNLGPLTTRMILSPDWESMLKE